MIGVGLAAGAIGGAVGYYAGRDDDNGG